MALIVVNFCARLNSSILQQLLQKLAAATLRGGGGEAGCRVQRQVGGVPGHSTLLLRGGGAMAELIPIPPGYPALLEEVKTRIRDAQLRAALTLNQETIQLYWSIGQDLSSRFAAEGWGTKVVDRLAKDLGTEFPGVEGFSLRNLRYMRSFAEAWPDTQILQLAAKLPWGHHMVLLDRLKEGKSREWYLRASLEYGWSRNVLTHHISTQLREREGKALTNFDRTLPTQDSDLTRQLLKNPYCFAF